MGDTIIIRWDTGYMEINLYTFFPTNSSQTKKVFRALSQDPRWTEERVKELLLYFKEQMEEESRYASRTAQAKAKAYQRTIDALTRETGVAL